MATVEEQLQQMRDAMENMHENMQRLTAELDQANARAQAADARADDANDRVIQALETVAGGKGSDKGKGTSISTLVDTRGIGRPDSFGKRDQRHLELIFPGWRRKTRNFLISWNPDIERLLDWCEQELKPLTPDVLSTQAESLMSDAKDLKNIDQQIYFMLISLTDGTTNNLVANSNTGFEAWRKLSRAYDPAGGGRV